MECVAIGYFPWEAKVFGFSHFRSYSSQGKKESWVYLLPYNHVLLTYLSPTASKTAISIQPLL
jgi:hypothetical protein